MTDNPRQADLAAVILTGGASRRMGQDKATRLWGGRRAVDLVADLARAAGATKIVTAGGAALGLPHAPDPAPFCGPVAGIKAAAAQLQGAKRWLILAVDAPTLEPEDLAPLLAAPAPGAAYGGFPLPMALWREALPAEAEDGWPLRRLAEQAGLARLVARPEQRLRLRGANTPAEQAALQALRTPP
jgi:molybdopterin-guanine dinucleotide biosynthesis protein A